MFTPTTLFTVLLAATPLVSAAAAALKPRLLSADQVIVYSNDGRVEVVDKATYLAHLNLPPRPSSSTLTPNTSTSTPARSTKSLSKRCSKSTIIYENPTNHFLNWDVAMSAVVRSPPASQATIAVTPGYSISNTLGVSVSTSMDLIKEFLSVSYTIDYEQSWSSSYSVAYTFEVPEGQVGAVVSNPTTTRHSGTRWRGCIGEAGEAETYMGDSYASRSFDGLSWVDGVIGLCTSASFPLKRCIGEGTL